MIHSQGVQRRDAAERQRVLAGQLYYLRRLARRTSLAFDAVGDRIKRDVWTTVGGPVTMTVYCYGRGDDVWFGLNAASAVTAQLVRGDVVDRLVARLGTRGEVGWYLPDREGSVRDLTDNTGTVRDHLDYDGFGQILTETNSAFGDVYKYTGREFDSETGLQFNRARYYDPKVGRWTTQDPLGLDAGDPNLYRYVCNQPTDATDPSGLDFIAVADRPVDVKGPGAVFRHYSLEYWMSNANVTVGQQVDKIPEFKTNNPGSVADKAVELGADQGWKVYAWNYLNPNFPKGGKWVVEDVNVAFIHYGDEKVQHFLYLFSASSSN